MSTALAAMLLALAYLVPEHYLPWDTFRSQAVAVLALLVVAAGAVLRRLPQEATARWSWPRIAVIPAALAIVPWLQWWSGQVTFLSDALLPSLYLMALTLAIGAGQRWAALDADALLRSLALGIGLAAVLSACIAIAQWQQISTPMFVIEVRPGDRPGANLGQPNQLATLLVLGLCMLLLAFERRWTGPVVSCLLASVLCLGLVCTMSRTGAVAASLLLIAVLTARKQIGMRLHAAVPLALAAGVVALVLLWDDIGAQLHLTGPTMAERVHEGTRRVHWAVIWDAVRRSPLLGYGWNQVAQAQQATAHLHPLTGELLQSSHNAWLDLWVWTGLPVGTVAGLAVTWWFFRRWRRCSNATQFGLLSCISAVLIHAMLEFPLDYTYFLLPMGLMMGLIAGMPPHPARPQFVSGARVPAAAVLAGSAMWLWISAEYLEVETQFRDARVGLLGYNNRIDIVPPPPVLLLDAPREYHRLMITSATRDMPANRLDWMHRVVQRYPFPPALMRYALAAGLNGQPEQAAAALRGLCAVHLPERCAEGRAAWAAAQAVHPALSGIAFPLAPTLSRSMPPGPEGEAARRSESGR